MKADPVRMRPLTRTVLGAEILVRADKHRHMRRSSSPGAYFQRPLTLIPTSPQFRSWTCFETALHMLIDM